MIQDYYTASNGVLDSFLNPKLGIADTVSARQTLQGLLNQTALLLSPPGDQSSNALPLGFRGGQALNTTIAISTYTPGLQGLHGTQLRWNLTLHQYDDSSGQVQPSVLASDIVQLGNALPAGEVVAAASIIYTFPSIGTFPSGGRNAHAAARVELHAELRRGDEVLAHNKWRTILFPSWIDGPSSEIGISLWSIAELMDACLFNNCELLPDSFKADAIPETNTSHRNVVLLTGPTIPTSAMQLLQAGASLVFVQNSSTDFWPSIPTRFKSAWWLGTEADNNCGAPLLSYRVLWNLVFAPYQLSRYG